MSVTIRFLLNGEPRIWRDVEPSRTLLQHLRLYERTPASKEGCAEGDCGACTVAIGRPNEKGGLTFKAVNSCILFAADLDGAAVVTAEGLADPESGTEHPAQRTMVELHGSQCGFCTPGFVMSMFVHERAGLSGETDTIHETLSGNLCRCTGYRPIVEAVGAMAAGGRDERFDAIERAWVERLQELMAEQMSVDAPSGFHAPGTLEELDTLTATYPQAKLLAGGTDLGVVVAKHAADPGTLISLRNLPALQRVVIRDGVMEIGSATTYEAALPFIQKSYPAFAGMIRRIGSRQVRNLGTIGGNICNASPIGDSAPCLLALGASVILRSANGERTVSLEDFFIGYRKTTLEPGEYLKTIHVPLLEAGDHFHAYKLSKRYDQDISTVSAAFRIRLHEGRVTEARIAFGGMAATPMRVQAMEELLVGTKLETAAIKRIAALVGESFNPLTDFRGSSDYRLKGAQGLLKRMQLEIISPETPTEIWSL